LRQFKQKCQTKRKIKFFKISVPKLFDWIENKCVFKLKLITKVMFS
jgi:hypothetical protein